MHTLTDRVMQQIGLVPIVSRSDRGELKGGGGQCKVNGSAFSTKRSLDLDSGTWTGTAKRFQSAGLCRMVYTGESVYETCINELQVTVFLNRILRKFPSNRMRLHLLQLIVIVNLKNNSRFFSTDFSFRDNPR